MNKFTIVTLISSVFLLLPLVAIAGKSEVVWSHYEKYRDIDSGRESRQSFRERTFEEFDRHFAKLSQKLPQGQTLKINVTDVDLAGETRKGSINQFRVVKEIYYPRINFSYEIVNIDSSIITSGEVALKDMNFMRGSSAKYRNKTLGYEKRMLDIWFADTFKKYTTEKK